MKTELILLIFFLFCLRQLFSTAFTYACENTIKKNNTPLATHLNLPQFHAEGEQFSTEITIPCFI